MFRIPRQGWILEEKWNILKPAKFPYGRITAIVPSIRWHDQSVLKKIPFSTKLRYLKNITTMILLTACTASLKILFSKIYSGKQSVLQSKGWEGKKKSIGFETLTYIHYRTRSEWVRDSERQRERIIYRDIYSESCLQSFPYVEKRANYEAEALEDKKK